MRLLVDAGSHMAGLGTSTIFQVEKTPPYLEGAPITSRFVLPIVPGAEFPVPVNAHVIPVDGSDVSSISFAHLLAQYPQYQGIYFNPLLLAENVAELDLAAVFNTTVMGTPIAYPVRCQTGRALGVQAGLMPTHTAILPINSARTPLPPYPGLLITNEIDLGPATGGAGSRTFMVYWKIFDFQVSHDIASVPGTWVTGGQNTPAIRQVFEVDQEPSGFSAYISPNDGATWIEVGLLEPVALCDLTTKVRVAFMNTASTKVYLANYAVLF